MEKLTAHPRLKQLVTDCHVGSGVSHALSTLLLSGVKLESLEVTCICWDEEKMEYLVILSDSCESHFTQLLPQHMLPCYCLWSRLA
jgi:hypothetical protein